MGNKSIDIERGDSDVTRLQGAESSEEWTNVVHRVPAKLREKKKHLYDPVVVSMGPFHHGQPHLGELENFKDELVAIMLREDEDRCLVFHDTIMRRIDKVRHIYRGLSREEHDNALARMMLRDACLLLFYLELTLSFMDDKAANETRGPLLQLLMFRYLGTFQLNWMWNDFLKLENQIPWWVLKLLVGANERRVILRVLCFVTYGNTVELKRLPWDENTQPLHFLEVLRTISLINLDENGSLDTDRLKGGHCSSKAKTWVAELINTNFRSPWAATALAAAALLLRLSFTQTYFTVYPRP